MRLNSRRSRRRRSKSYTDQRRRILNRRPIMPIESSLPTPKHRSMPLFLHLSLIHLNPLHLADLPWLNLLQLINHVRVVPRYGGEIRKSETGWGDTSVWNILDHAEEWFCKAFGSTLHFSYSYNELSRYCIPSRSLNIQDCPTIHRVSLRHRDL